MKKNSLLMRILGMTLVFGMMFAACEFSASGSIDIGGNGNTTPLAEGVYVGIISFDEYARAITPSPILLDSGGKTALTTAIDSQYKQGTEGGTLLYYAVHKALHTMKGLESRLPANAQSFDIITFTDGIDVGSGGSTLWRDEPLDGQNFTGNTADYLTWLNTQLETTKIKGYPITASSYGVAGSDVTDSNVFKDNLAKLATSTGQTSTSIKFDELSDTFGQIASGLNVSSTSFDLYITQGDNGTVYKMTFDNVTDEDKSQVYFSGTYNYSNGTHTLTDIQYVGMEGSVTSITGTEVGRKVKFRFGTFSLSSGSIVKDHIQQWFKSPNATNWQRNSEYDQQNTTTVDKSSAVIYLVLDSSKSLSNDNVSSIKAAAKNFIDVLYDKYNGITAPSSAPTNLKATALSTDTIELTWSPVSGAKSYKIYYAMSTTGTYYFADSNTTTSYIDDYSLEANTTYYYKVSAVNNVGEGPLSSYVSVTTKAVQTKADLLRIYNDSSKDIVWLGVWDVAADDWWTSGNTLLTPNYYWHWANGVPLGKRYQLSVKDVDGYEVDSPIFLLPQNQNQVTSFSYDGQSLKLKN
jgi:hypothetical protein